jgi:PTS system nitrogen regulatory IIA component
MHFAIQSINTWRPDRRGFSPEPRSQHKIIQSHWTPQPPHSTMPAPARVISDVSRQVRVTSKKKAAPQSSPPSASIIRPFLEPKSASSVPDEDFDIAALAAYLHMMPAQIARLADRGQLPGRRVGGQWRFSPPEITQWLEQRIGLSDDEALAAMESNLERTDRAGAGEVNFAELLPLDAVAAPRPARTRTSVIDAMCRLAAATGALWDAAKMAQAVAAREDMASTALDNGVAMLHPRRPQISLLGQAVLALGVTAAGIPFGAAGGGLTDIFFLIAATNDHEHLRILARLSRITGDPALVSALRGAGDAPAARQLVLARDAALSAN